MSYWRESSSADSLDKNTYRPKEIRDIIIDLINDRESTMNLKPMLKAIDFDSLKNETQKLLDNDVILNLLLQQGYITVIGDRTCGDPVEIKAPNYEVKAESNELLREYYAEVCRFDRKKMRECRDCFLNMDMEEASCEENLKRVEKIMNELFSAVNLSEINESWFKSFIFQLFFQNFRIQEQKSSWNRCQK